MRIFSEVTSTFNFPVDLSSVFVMVNMEPPPWSVQYRTITSDTCSTGGLNVDRGLAVTQPCFERLYFRLSDVAEDGRERVHLYARAHGALLERPAHSVIYHVGDEATACYVVESGMLKVFRVNEEGRVFTLGLTLPGASVSIAEVINQVPHIATVETVVPTRLWQVSATLFRQAIEEDHQIATAVLRLLAGRYLQFHDLAENLGTLDTGPRIAQLFTRLANEAGEFTARGIVIHLSLTHEDISQLIGATRPFTTTILRQMHEAGLILTSRNEACIPDLERLAAFALTSRRCANSW